MTFIIVTNNNVKAESILLGSRFLVMIPILAAVVEKLSKYEKNSEVLHRIITEKNNLPFMS